MSQLKQEVQNALDTLKRGGLILYPTDTVWGIGCDATHPLAIERIYKLKNRSDSKALICLVGDLSMLDQFVEQIPKAAHDILKFAVTPTTIVYDDPIRVAENLIANDNSLAFRISENEFCKKLTRKLHRPIVATSANISGSPTPKSFKEIAPEILEGVDYVVNLHREKTSEKPSTIIKLTRDGKVSVLRE